VSSGGEDPLAGELGAHLARLATWLKTAVGRGHPRVLLGARKASSQRAELLFTIVS
jgi:hypothetical protein